MTTTATDNPWRVVTWSDAHYRPVRVFACHESELPKVLELPWPDGAAARDPVEMLTNFAQRIRFFSWRKPFPAKVGDFWQEDINQGLRDCSVVAFDDETGEYLYEYDMPGGRTFLRNQSGRPVNRNRLSRKWRVLLGDETCPSNQHRAS